MSIIKKTILGTALAASALTASAPAMARDYYRGDHDNAAAVAIGAGVVGLALGAIIASSNNDDRYRNRYYDNSYYSGPAYTTGWYYRDGYYWDRDGGRHSRDEYGRHHRDHDRRGGDWRGNNWQGGNDWRRGYDHDRDEYRRGY